MTALWLPLLWTLQAAGEPKDDRHRWLPPVKTVTLEGVERTLGEALELIRKQTGLTIEATGAETSRRLTVEFKDRPVLEALDALCRAIGKGAVKSRREEGGSGPIELDGDAPLSPAASHWHQFRVDVTDVQVTVRRSLSGVDRTANVNLRMTSQPGTRPLAMGPFHPDEAIDDTGWSLLSNAPRYRGSEDFGEEDDPDVVTFDDDWAGRRQTQDLTAALRGPGDNARSIERLRGRVLLAFPMRHVDESVPVSDLVPGKELRIGAAGIRVRSFKQDGDKVKFVYEVRAPGGRGRFPSFPDFELMDGDGQKVSRGRSGSGSEDAYTVEYGLTKNVPVTHLRYRAYLGRFTVTVPVDLRNIPLPAKNR